MKVINFPAKSPSKYGQKDLAHQATLQFLQTPTNVIRVVLNILMKKI